MNCRCAGDVNFAPELSDLRYRHHLRVILIHRHHVTDALLSCAHERYDFLELFADVTDSRVNEVQHSLCNHSVFLWWLWHRCISSLSLVLMGFGRAFLHVKNPATVTERFCQRLLVD